MKLIKIRSSIDFIIPLFLFLKIHVNIHPCFGKEDLNPSLDEMLRPPPAVTLSDSSGFSVTL